MIAACCSNVLFQQSLPSPRYGEPSILYIRASKAQAPGRAAIGFRRNLQQEHDTAVKEAARPLQLDTGKVMEQSVSDMQDRLVDVTVRVAGRLVKRNTPHKDFALLSDLLPCLLFCKDSGRQRHLQQWLTRASCSYEPEEVPAHFDMPTFAALCQMW